MGGSSVIRSTRIKEWDELTAKQQKFVNEYMTNGYNATQAFKDTYAWDRKSVAHIIRKKAAEIRHHPSIDAAIKARMHMLMMSEAEALARQAEAGRLDIGEVLVSDPIVCPECGHVVAPEGEWRVDLAKAKELNMTSLIKKISYDKQGRIVVEFRDPDAAQKTVLQAHGALNGRKKDNPVDGLAALIKAAQASDLEARFGGRTPVEDAEVIVDG